MGRDVNPHFTISSSAKDRGATVAICETWTYKGTKVVAKVDMKATYKEIYQEVLSEYN